MRENFMHGLVGEVKLIRRRGFTLIELLLAIAIIGILASLLFPALSEARNESIRTVCISNLKQAGIAQTLYEDDNQSFPFVGFFMPAVVKTTNSALSMFPLRLAAYTGDIEGELSRLFNCPGFTATLDGAGADQAHHFTNEGFIIDSSENYLWDGVGSNPLRAYGKPEHLNIAPTSMERIIVPHKTYSVIEIFSVTGTEWGKIPNGPMHGFKGAAPRRNVLFFDGSAMTRKWQAAWPYQ